MIFYTRNRDLYICISQIGNPPTVLQAKTVVPPRTACFITIFVEVEKRKKIEWLSIYLCGYFNISPILENGSTYTHQIEGSIPED